MLRSLVLVLLVAGAIYVACACVFHYALHDESIYVGEALCLVRARAVPRVYPLTPALLSIAILTAPPSAWEASVKALVIAVSLALVALSYREMGLAASLFLALSPMMVFLSSHAMTEPLFALTVLGSYVALRRLVENPSLPRAAALGVLLYLSYLAKVSAIPLIAGFLIYALYRLARSGRLRAGLAATGITSALIGLWLAAEHAAYHEVATSLRYTSSFVRFSHVLQNLSPRLLALTIAKAAAGATLCFLPYVLLLIIEAALSRGASIPLDVPREARLGAALYALTVLGYFVALSLGQGYPESIDHMARYLAPLLPLVRVRRSELRARDVAILAVSVAAGLYLQVYAAHHALHRLAWSEMPREAERECAALGGAS